LQFDAFGDGIDESLLGVALVEFGENLLLVRFVFVAAWINFLKARVINKQKALDEGKCDLQR